MPDGGGLTLELRRLGDASHVALTRRGSASDDSPVQAVNCPAEVRQAYREQRAALDADFGQLSLRPQVPLRRYRDVTILLIGVYLAQELVLLLATRRKPRVAAIVRVCSCIIVIAGAILLVSRWSGTSVF
jgi:hypothetical protein